MKSLEKHAHKLMLLGNNIAFYRRKEQLSQLELAEKVGISRTHMSNIEAPNVAHSFSINVLFNIAEVLEIEPMKLFDFNK